MEQKQNALKTQQRKLKWRRVMLATMLMATMVVSIASVSRSIYVTVEPARGQLCITTFNDLNSNGLQDASEPAFFGFQVEVRGTDLAKTLTTDVNGSICSDLPIGTYSVVEQPRDGLIATTPTTQTVTIAADQTAKLSFGGRQETGSIRIAKFDDLNSNGVQDPGELGVSGIVLQVSGTDVTTTLTTGPDGVASAVVPVGTYTLVEQPQDGTTPITQTVTVTEGHTVNFSFAIGKARGTLCIRTFDDSNSNRARDDGEVGLPGFLFQVHGPGTAITLTTNPNGICSDLPVGAYTVVEQPQGGWVATTPTAETVTITAGQTANLLFGSRRETGKLCIATFNDRNGDGVRDAGEPALSGFVFEVRGTNPAKTVAADLRAGVCSVLPVGTYTVVEKPLGGWITTTPTTQSVTVVASQDRSVLFGSRQETGKLCITAFDDLNGNHAHEQSEAVLSSVVFQVNGTSAATSLKTDPRGGACTDLPAGTYTVIEQPRSGWIATKSTTQTVTVTANQTVNMLFGSRRETGKLCIRTFNDLNRNRVQDKNEAVLSSVVFQVNGTSAATSLTTDPGGGACSDLPAGTYTVAEQPRSGWIATTPTTLTVTVTAGETANVSFGSRKEARPEGGSLCIRAFHDPNRNGFRDADEQGLPRFVFQVSGTGATKMLTTDVEGSACADLPVGTYTVMEIPKPGWIATTTTKRTVIITANQATLFFGNVKGDTKSDAACDQRREGQIILNQYGSKWRQSIETERESIIAEAAPRANGKVTARLGPLEPQVAFKTCTRVSVALRYVWIVEVLGGNERPRRQPVRRERNYSCDKTSGGWVCSQ